MARYAEQAGIPTLCMGSALDILKAVNPPRIAFLDYPLGHTTGKPHDPDLQRRILMQAIDSFNSLTAPGSVNMLNFRWSESETWKEAAQRDGDVRTQRQDTPQYQTEDDRLRAESRGAMRSKH